MTAKQARERVTLSEEDQVRVHYIFLEVVAACANGDYMCDTKTYLSPNLFRHFTALGYTIGISENEKGTHQLFWCNSKHNQ
jgi:Leu/Phe-tRNA-protein transferase